MTDNPQMLSYGSPRRRWYLDRRLHVTAVVVMLVTIAYLVIKPVVQPHLDQRRFLKLQEKMSHNVHPDGTVVYTEDESLIKQLQGRPEYVFVGFGQSSEAARKYADWPRQLEITRFDSFGGHTLRTNYRGIRKTRAGQDRLVATGVSVFPRNDQQRMVGITYFAITLANRTPGSRGKEASLNHPGLLLDKSDRLTMYVGRSDPNDSGLIVVPYTLNGESGELHLRLRNDAALLLTVASGPARKAPRWWTYPDPIPPDNIDNPGGIWPPRTRPASQPSAGQ